MNKKELIAQMAENTGLSKKNAAAALEAFQDITITCMAEQDKLVLPGFGSFDVNTRAAHIGIDPRTGERIDIPVRYAVRFKAGVNLKNACK